MKTVKFQRTWMSGQLFLSYSIVLEYVYLWKSSSKVQSDLLIALVLLSHKTQAAFVLNIQAWSSLSHMSHTCESYISLAYARFLLYSTSSGTRVMALPSLLCHDTPLFWWITRSLKLGSFLPMSFCRPELPVASLPGLCYGADLWLINPTAKLKWSRSFFLSVFHIRESFLILS